MYSNLESLKYLQENSFIDSQNTDLRKEGHLLAVPFYRMGNKGSELFTSVPTVASCGSN